ncbi:MAG: hypothetical protein KKC71_03105 [Chloroflexi bacterium]|nr:hypothetical protein [Chloroflexota bacterium]
MGQQQPGDIAIFFGQKSMFMAKAIIPGNKQSFQYILCFGRVAISKDVITKAAQRQMYQPYG